MTMYSLGEFHKFHGGGQDFLYLVPSGGIVALDGMTSEILEQLDQMPLSREDLIGRLCSDGYSSNDVEECIDELREVKAIRNGQKEYAKSEPLPEAFAGRRPLLRRTRVRPVFRSGQSCAAGLQRSYQLEDCSLPVWHDIRMVVLILEHPKRLRGF